MISYSVPEFAGEPSGSRCEAAKPRSKTRPKQTEDHVEGRCVRNLLLKRFREIEWLVFPEIRVEHDAAGELRIQPGDGFARDPALVSHVSGTAHEK